MLTKQKSYAGDGSYPTSYYAASRNIVRTPVRLQGRVETDICVVGAGYSGLSTAIHLAEKGYKVVVIEGAQVGWGPRAVMVVRSSTASMPALPPSSAAMARMRRASSAGWCRRAARSSAVLSANIRSTAT